VFTIERPRARGHIYSKYYIYVYLWGNVYIYYTDMIVYYVSNLRIKTFAITNTD